MLGPLFSALHALAVDDASGGGGLSLHLLAAFHVQCVSQVIAVVLRPVLALDVAAILDAAGGRNAAGSQGRTTNPGRYAGKTGVNNVVPAIKSLLSMLPVWTPGGELLIRPMTGSGATPIVPKNGLFTGHYDPRRDSRGFRLAVDWNDSQKEARKLVGERPHPGDHLFLFQIFRDCWRRRCGPASIFSFFKFFEIAGGGAAVPRRSFRFSDFSRLQSPPSAAGRGRAR